MMITRLQHILFAALCAVFFGTSTVFSQPLQGDFDGDGLADPAVVLSDKGRQISAYLAQNVLSGAIAKFATFPVAGDAFVSGRWFPQDNRTFPAVIFVRDAALPLEWYFSGPDGFQLALPYGLPGDIIPNQMDLDCDGVTDMAVVRERTTGAFAGYNFWYLRLSSQGFQIVETLFGLNGDKMYVSDTNGDGCGELVALREGFQWFTRGALGGDTSAVQWGLDGDFPLLPRDIDGDLLPDYIVSRAGANGQVAYIRFGNGQQGQIPLGGVSSIPMIGNFLQGAPLEFAWWDRTPGANGQGTLTIRQNDGTVLPVPFGIQQNALVRPNGAVVLPSEDGRFGSNNSGGGSNAGCTPTADSPSDFVDGGGGLLWKPRSDGVSNGAPALLFPTSTLGGNLVILAADGSVASPAQRSNRCCPNGGRNHFWSAKTASQLRPFAPLTVKLAFKNRVWCLNVPDPTQRYD